MKYLKTSLVAILGISLLQLSAMENTSAQSNVAQLVEYCSQKLAKDALQKYSVATAQFIIDKIQHLNKAPANGFTGLNKARLLTYEALAHKDLGQFKKAAALLQEAQESLMVLALNPANPLLKEQEAKITAYQAVVLGFLKQPAKALELYKEVLPLYKKYFGADSLETAWLLTNFGNNYRDTGNHTDAVALYKQAVPLFVKHLGENNVATGWAQANLADGLRELGDAPQAQEILEKVQPLFNGDPIKEAWIDAKLAKAYADLKEYQKADSLFSKVLATFKSSYGNDSVKNIPVLMQLGTLLAQEGKFAQAHQLLQEALAIINVHYKQDFTYVSKIHFAISLTYFLEGNLEAAQESLNKVLAIPHPKQADKIKKLEANIKASLVNAQK